MSIQPKAGNNLKIKNEKYKWANTNIKCADHENVFAVKNSAATFELLISFPTISIAT